MKIMEAKKEQWWFKNNYPELSCKVVFVDLTLQIELSGKIIDGQGNYLELDTRLSTVEDVSGTKIIIKEFFQTYTPRQIDLDDIKTFTFTIQPNETISWKQFSDFLAWRRIPYYTNPITRLVTVEMDLPA